MSPEQIANILAEQFPGGVESAGLDTAHPHVVVAAEVWLEVARFLRDDERLGFRWLRCISSIDRPDEGQVGAVYDLHGMEVPDDYDAEAVAQRPPLVGSLWTERHAFAVRVMASRDEPHIPSVASVWPAATWHEREAYDMMGIVFDGHPHLTRILCPDDWVGHPLRKDYAFPAGYGGIADPSVQAKPAEASE